MDSIETLDSLATFSVFFSLIIQYFMYSNNTGMLLN